MAINNCKKSAAAVGLGPATKFDVLEIRWPSGLVEKLEDLPANQILSVKEGVGIVKHSNALSRSAPLPSSQGEGMLVYPGRKAGVRGTVPSLRLKWIREGVEDYECIEVMTKAGKVD